ncbi:MAG: MATE family efflux transporter [Pyrinomonadaceae bacterium]
MSLKTASDVTHNNSFLSILREAITGSSRDFTTEPLGISLFLLAVPMILEMVMESVFAVVDVFFVGRLGPEAITIVGMTESMMFIIYAVGIGIGISGMAMISRRIGEKNPDGAAVSATHTIYMGIAASLLMAVISIVFAPDFLRLLGAEPEIVIRGSLFARITLGGNLAVIMLFVLNFSFRGAGDASLAMRVLWAANILNCVLDPLLIFGIGPFPELGVNGAAIATLTGRSLGVLLAGYFLFRRVRHFTIRKEHWLLNTERLRRLLSLAWVAVLQFLIGTTSWLGLMKVMALFGSKAVAGYTIAIRVVIFALLPSVGMSNAAATMVGQNLGAKRPERAEKSVWLAALANAVFQTTIGIIFALFAHQIASIFTSDPETLKHAEDALRIISYGFLFYAIGMVLESCFNGAGDTRTPTLLNLFVLWIFEVPLAYFLAIHFGLGTHGVFWAITLAFSMLALVSGILFKRGRWKEVVV